MSWGLSSNFGTISCLHEKFCLSKKESLVLCNQHLIVLVLQINLSFIVDAVHESSGLDPCSACPTMKDLSSWLWQISWKMLLMSQLGQLTDCLWPKLLLNRPHLYIITDKVNVTFLFSIIFIVTVSWVLCSICWGCFLLKYGVTEVQFGVIWYPPLLNDWL